MGVRDDGKYDILYEDGDGESEVPQERVRAMAGAATNSEQQQPSAAAEAASSANNQPASKPAGAGAPYSEGDTVEMRHRGKAWRKARVVEVDAELQCANLELSDGAMEKGVPFALIRAVSGVAEPVANPAVADAAGSQTKAREASRSERRDKKTRRKKLNAVHELCRQFGDSELDTALQMLQLFHAEVVRASHAETMQAEAAATAANTSEPAQHAN